MTGYQSNSRFEAFDGAATPRTATLAFNHVGAGYFRTMTTRILDGREFEPGERRRDVCVLNEGAARTLFPGQPALGQYVRTPANAGLDIVRGGQRRPRRGSGRHLSRRRHRRGREVRQRARGAADDDLLPAHGRSWRRQPRVPAECAHEDERDLGYREALREIAPTVPLVRFVTLREQMEAALGSQRAITFLSTFFGVVALLLERARPLRHAVVERLAAHGRDRHPRRARRVTGQHPAHDPVGSAAPRRDRRRPGRGRACSSPSASSTRCSTGSRRSTGRRSSVSA